MKDGFLRVAAASPRLTPADPAANIRALIASAHEAEQMGATVLVTPRLSISGSELGDLLSMPALLSGCEAALAEYLRETASLSLLSFADNSERNLKMKLCRAGFSSSASESAVREVVRLGYLNEDEQLRRAILYEVNSRLTGPMKLMSKLCAKGYSSSLIKATVGALRDEGLIDFDENRRALLDKKLDADATPEQKQKLLKSYGYKCYD